MEQESLIKNIFLNLGADLCGIAGIDGFNQAPPGFQPVDIYKDCKSVIVFAKKMPLGSMLVSPRLIYLQAMNQLIRDLDTIALQASLELEELDGIGIPVPADDPYEYWDSEKQEGRGLISLKHAAEAAGLGKIGKNTLLINKKYGNRLSLCAVLTNLNLNPDPLEREDPCLPGCSLCISNCPQKALDGTTVNQKKCRQIVYGKNERGFTVCNCNKCRIVCPLACGQINLA